MPEPTFQPLPENADLVFVGEPAWATGALTPAVARDLWGRRTANQRPYHEVLRCFLGVNADGLFEHWQIDFPEHYTEQEVGLYPEALTHLRLPPAAAPQAGWWKNPSANRALRTTLARRERYCATPRDWPAPQWNWVESTWLPDSSLVAVALDDDFSQGVLRSRFFTQWWKVLGGARSSEQIVASFPFPWAPTTATSALTGLQQDLRFAISRAARGEDQDEIDRQVATAYGWPVGLSPVDSIQRLLALNTRRSG